MTQEEKQLLLKDLCTRLPYHSKIRIYNDSWDGCKRGEFNNTMGFHHVEAFLCDRIEILPYLRSLSNMTNEEREYLESLTNFHATPDVVRDKIDFYLERHLDYRGLIKKGLVLEAPEGMYLND